MSSSLRTPPSGATFSTATSAAPSTHDVQRVVGLADALVGGDRHVDPAPQLGQLGHRRARLLQVFERAVGRQRLGGGDRLVDAPAAVGVDAHRRHQCAHGVDPRDVVGQ